MHCLIVTMIKQPCTVWALLLILLLVFKIIASVDTCAFLHCLGCIALYYLVILGSFNFYEKKVINQHHIQNCIVIYMFKLGDTIT